MRPPQRAVVDDHVDRPQVEAWRHVEPSGTNCPRACASRPEAGRGNDQNDETDAGPAARPGPEVPAKAPDAQVKRVLSFHCQGLARDLWRL